MIQKTLLSIFILLGLGAASANTNSLIETEKAPVSIDEDMDLKTELFFTAIKLAEERFPRTKNKSAFKIGYDSNDPLALFVETNTQLCKMISNWEGEITGEVKTPYSLECSYIEKTTEE